MTESAETQAEAMMHRLRITGAAAGTAKRP